MNLSNENLDKYSSLTDIENKVEELKTNKDEKKALRFKLFNKPQEPEGDLIKPKTEIHLDSQNNADNN